MRPKFARPVARLSRPDWYRVENRADGAEVYIYDEIGMLGVSAKQFVADFDAITAKHVTLRVNSPGGDVFDGLAIYNAVKRRKGACTAVVDGLAASAASFIVQAADRVVMTRNSQMMIHDAFGLCVGNAADMHQMAELLDKASDNIADIYAQRAGGTVDQWRNRMRTETWYSASEAVDAGLADTVDGETENTSNDWDLGIFNYSGRDQAPAPEIEIPDYDCLFWDALREELT